MTSNRTALDDLLGSLARVAPPLEVNTELARLSGAHDAQLDFDLALPLLPYQRAGVLYALRQRRVILGDEMGLGKTPQLIAVAVKAVSEGKRALIVVPPSLRLQWVREIAKFAPTLSAVIVEGTKPHAIPAGDVVIIGDATLTPWAPALARENFGALLVDESHRFKNEKTKRTIALAGLARGVPEDGYVVLASGTPVVNRPVELVAPLDIIGRLQPVFQSAGAFKYRYCDPQRNAFGWTFVGASNTAELHDKLRGTCFIRRKKEEVLSELPPKRRAQVAIALDDRALREYLRIEREFLSWVFEQGGKEAVLKASRAETIVQLTALRQAVAVAKVPAVIEQIESILDADQPVVVFAHHRAVIDGIVGECERRGVEDPRWSVVKIVGGLGDEAKQDAVDAFQQGRVNVIVCNYTAGGVGLTLTRASQWIGAELPWTPAELQQAEDRIHRIGQDAESVTCWHLTGARTNGELTIDDRLFALLNSKAEITSSITDGVARDLDAESGSIIGALLDGWIR